MTSPHSDNTHVPVETEAFRLGDCLVTPAHNAIEAEGRRVRLQPKVMEVLCYLARHHQRVVSNEELTREVWQGRVVTHGSVQKSIAQLRKGFADILQDQDVVAHYSKRGYQLQVAPVYLMPDAQQAADAHPAKRRLGPPAVISVLLPLLALVLVAALFYAYQSRYVWVLSKDHRTAFTQISRLTEARGFERSAEPHPNNRHLAYIVDSRVADEHSGDASYLVVRDDQGLDWWLAGSPGNWQEPVWSPDGRQLAVVEQTQENSASQIEAYSPRSVQLYDIHVFAVDLHTSRVLGKHRLSQWHGHISSMTWRDDNTLELVGRQGEALIRQRYSYTLDSQRLEVIEAPDQLANPTLTRVHRGLTAVVRQRDAGALVDFLRPDQTRFARHALDYRVDDMSWLPDGGGVVVAGERDAPLEVLYRNGKRLALPFERDYDALYGRPRYSADGTRIYMTRIRPNAQIGIQTTSGDIQPLSDRGLWRQGAVFCPSGQRVAFVSVLDNRPQVRVLELDTGETFALDLAIQTGPIYDLIWVDTDNLLFKVGDHLYRHSLQTQRTGLLRSHARVLTPLALLQDSSTLLALRHSGDASNLWRFDLDSGEERQLTFGSLAAAVAYADDVYFQYAGQMGLWVWRAATGELVNLNRRLPRDSRILSADATGVYYVSGSPCRESAIHYLPPNGNGGTTWLSDARDEWHTTAFHPRRGALVGSCGVSQSTLMVLE